MCQRNEYLHTCNHTTIGPLKKCGLQLFPLFHKQGLRRDIYKIPTPCSACSPAIVVQTVPIQTVQTVPVTPVVYIPIVPNPNHQPLPVPAATPTSVKYEVIGGKVQPVVVYGTPQTSSNQGNGYNPIHGVDPGALPPGWGARPNPFPAKGYNPIHGADPGAPPPGWGGNDDVPVPTPIPAAIHAPAVAPTPVLASVPPQPQATVQPRSPTRVRFADPVATPFGANAARNNTQTAARPADVSSTAATDGSVSGRE